MLWLQQKKSIRLDKNVFRIVACCIHFSVPMIIQMIGRGAVFFEGSPADGRALVAEVEKAKQALVFMRAHKARHMPVAGCHPGKVFIITNHR